MITSDAVYSTYPAEFAAVVQEGEASVAAAFSATPVHRLYLEEALLAYRKALLPTLAIVSAHSHPELSSDAIIEHLRARARTDATGVIDAISTRMAETQRFAGARFREATEVARWRQQTRAIQRDTY